MALPKVGVEAVIEGMAKFEADSKKVNKSLDNMGTSTSRLGSIASGVTSKLTSLAGSLLKIGAVGAGVAIAGIGAGLYTAASAGLSFNNSMEQASAKINAFTKDADLTAQILEDVRMEAAKTPFEFEAMANAVSGLLPAAKQADIGIMDLLRDAEVLAASNPAEGLEGAAFALREAVSGDFTSVIERFNLPRSMINKLKAEGLPALDIVRTAMREMGYDMDLVSALANTAEGRWSTFKDTLTNLAGTVTQPLFNALSGGLGSVNDWLTLITPQLESFATMLAGQVAGALTAVASSVMKIAGAFAQFGARGAAVSILGQLGFDPTQISQVMGVADTIVGAFDKILGAYERFGARGATTSLLGQLGLSPEAMGQIRSIIDATIPYIIEQFSSLSTLLAPSIASFQESLDRLKVTFPGLSAAVGEFSISAASLTQFLLTQANFILNTVIPAWIQWIGFLAGVAAKTVSLWVTYIQAVQSAWQTLSAFVQSNVIPALLSINDGITVINTVLASFGNLVSAVVNKALTAMAGLWQNVVFPALKKTGDFLNANLFPAFQSVGKTVNEDVSPVLRDLGEVILPMIQEAMDFVNEAVERTISFFNSLASTINDISLPPWLQMHSPPPLATALDIIAGSAGGANAAITGMMNSLASNKWDQIRGDVLDLVDDMQDEGFYASRGFGKSTGFAIKQAFIRAFTANFQGILSGTVGADALLALTRHEAGAYAERVTGDFGKIIARARAAGVQMLQELKQELLEALPAVAGGLSGLAGTFAEMLQAGMGEKGRITKELSKIGDSNARLASDNVDLNDTISDQSEKMSILQAEMAELTSQEELDTIAIDRKRLAIEELNEAMDKNRKKILQNNSALAQSQVERKKLFQNVTVADEIELLQDFLAGTEDQFNFTLKSHLVGVDSIMLNRVKAQQQLNFLLAEQQAKEEQITKQKEAQQKLSFLQAQVDLIKIGRELGGNVFQGITFGLHASAEDLLRATNNVVEAMIGQIHTTLEIGSPSRVMMEVGQQIMAGLQRGIVSMTPTLNAQLSASVMGPLSPMMAGAMSAGNQNTTVHNWNVGGNNFYNQTDEAVFEAKVMRAIRRNL